MNSNQENNQFGQDSKIEKRQEEKSGHYETANDTKRLLRNPATSDDDFLSGDNRAKYHPNLDQYEVSTEQEDRYNNGTSEHDDFIDNEISEEETKTRYSSPSRNGSYRNH